MCSFTCRDKSGHCWTVHEYYYVIFLETISQPFNIDGNFIMSDPNIQHFITKIFST